MVKVYQTQKYLDDLKSYQNEKSRFDKFIIKLENQNDSDQLLIELKPNFFKAKITSDIRLIIQKVVILDISVFIFIAIFKHDYSYKEFSIDTSKWIEKHGIKEDDIEFYEIENWLKQLLKREEAESTMSDLPDSIKEWLYTSDFEVHNHIYEMQEWTESIIKDEIRNYRAEIPNAIFNIYEGNTNTIDVKFPRETMKLGIVRNDIYILFEQYGDALFLFNIYKDKPTNDLLRETYKVYEYDKKPVNGETLKRDARRAYPTYILAEEDVWFEIQDDCVGNLALSPEQVELLKSPTYPIFINGQAGSGKSTMLFYLFAHIVHTHRGNNYKPLFLTYNKRLLETARNTIKIILNKHPNFTEKKIPEKEIDEMFYPFQEFILNELLDVEQRKLFSKEKYISFNRFRRYYIGNEKENELCCRLGEKNQFTPELVWHILRTYIKGSTIDEFTINHFNELPRKDKTVSENIFKNVKLIIYERWYKIIEQKGYWDDQDLILYVLRNISLQKHYPVIFCDESQDFTKNEIELILRLSSFTKYNLHDNHNLPIAFAGDPYQTINPTGFRWESLKSIFSDKFNSLIKTGNIEINFKPLEQNYRSKPEVIKFSNIIQLFRRTYLNINELEPQIPYQRARSIDSCLFILNDNISENNIRDVSETSIFIVPSDSDVNSEIEFVGNDSTLKQFISIPSVNEIPIANVLSAASAKGLEYDKVIVYKFGTNAPKSFKKAFKNENLSDSEYIELSHYFNKLYVAISRARDYLFIVEDENGYNDFWKYFMSSSNIFEVALSINGKWKQEHINYIVKGRQEDIDFIKEENPIKVAKTFEDEGMSSLDATLLYRASKYYELSKDYDSSKRCIAWANYYSEKWYLAGQCFRELQKLKEAFESFWKGKCWNEIVEIYENNERNYRVRIAKFMNGKNTIDLVLGDNDFIEGIEINDEIWLDIIKRVKESIKVDIYNKTSKKAEFAYKIAQKGLKDFFDLAADLYYSDSLFEKAIEMWDRNKGANHIEYYNAKLNVEKKSNDQIKWLSKLNEYDKIIGFINDTDLNLDSHKIIFDALISKNRFVEASSYKYIKPKVRVEKLIEIINTNSTEKTEYLNRKSSLILLMIQEEEYDYLRENYELFQDALDEKFVIEYIFREKNGVSFIKYCQPIIIRYPENNLLNCIIDVICDDINEGNNQQIGLALDFVSLNKNKILMNNVKIVKAIANSTNNLELLQNDASRLRGILNQWFWENKDWNKFNIGLRELVIAAEKANYLFKDLYPVLEYIIQHEPNYEKKWAKEKYIVIKRKQAEYELKRQNLQRAEEIKVEISQKMIEWGLVKIKSDKIVFSGIHIFGMNNFSSEEDLTRNRITFKLPNYEVRINSRTHMISIENIETSITDNVDMIKKEFNSIYQIEVEKYNLKFSQVDQIVTFELDNHPIKILIKK